MEQLIDILQKLGTAFIAGLIAIGSYVGPTVEKIWSDVTAPINAPLGATVNPVGGKNYALSGGGMGSSDTTINLTEFTQPVTGYKLAMADFGRTGYVTIEPGSATRQEFIAFEGITQNSDGTATLTGLTRGLAPVSPFTASSTLQKAHPGGSVVVISNPPQLYSEFANRTNPQDIYGLWTFGIAPIATGTATSTSQLATRAYVNAVAVSGAATSTESLGGLVELATLIEQASSTNPSADQPLVLYAKHSTSTPDVRGSYNIVADSDGYLHQNWLDLSEAFTLTGQLNLDAATTTLSSATTTFDLATALVAVGTSTPTVIATGVTIDDHLYVGGGVTTGDRAATTSGNVEIGGSLYIGGSLQASSYASFTFLGSRVSTGDIDNTTSTSTFTSGWRPLVIEIHYKLTGDDGGTEEHSAGIARYSVSGTGDSATLISNLQITQASPDGGGNPTLTDINDLFALSASKPTVGVASSNCSMVIDVGNVTTTGFDVGSRATGTTGTCSNDYSVIAYR